MKEHLNNKKYQALVSTGKNLFWKFGLKRVSIEEICKEASVSKMTFYKFFPNKIELAKTILDNIMKDSTIQFSELLMSSISFKEKVRQMLLMKMEGTKDLSAEFLNDIYQYPENELQQCMHKYREESMQLFIQFLQNAKNDGFIRGDIKIEFILYQIDLMTKTANDKNMQGLYSTPGDLIMESMNFLFYGLMPEHNNTKAE